MTNDYFVQDIDDMFENEKQFLIEYHAKIRDATLKADRMTKVHKSKMVAPRT